jgi:7-cyano-7-deazaguanine synthase
MMKALVLFSGGADSLFCLFQAREQFHEVTALAFDYGQRHNEELNSAHFICEKLGIEFETCDLRGVLKSGSILTDESRPMETYANYDQAWNQLHGKIESSFIPMRNSIFMSIAVNNAAVSNCDAVFIGISKEDADTMPDCSEQWFELFGREAKIAFGGSWQDKSTIHLIAPLLTMGKPWSIKEGVMHYKGFFTALAFSHTAYSGTYPPEKDHASLCREDAFEKAKLPDPLLIRAFWENRMELPLGPFYRAWKPSIDSFPAERGYGKDVFTMPWEDMSIFEEKVRRWL